MLSSCCWNQREVLHRQEFWGPRAQQRDCPLWRTNLAALRFKDDFLHPHSNFLLKSKNVASPTRVGGLQPNSKLARCDALAWSLSRLLGTLSLSLSLSLQPLILLHTLYLRQSYPQTSPSLAHSTFANRGGSTRWHHHRLTEKEKNETRINTHAKIHFHTHAHSHARTCKIKKPFWLVSWT